MNDLISRQQAIDKFEPWLKVEGYSEGEHNMLRAVLYELIVMPSAQPTATWLIRRWGDDAQCSNCGKSFKDVYDVDNYDKFCRHCGVQMKGMEHGTV